MEPFRLRSFSQDCRERYGQAIGKIPLDLGLPCPNRARGGCLFCHPASFTPASLRPFDPLSEQIRRGKHLLLKGRFRRYLAYFQQETSTALPTKLLLPHLAQVLADTDCLGLILSTRPDAIASDLPAALAHLMAQSGKDCLIELGLQSRHERSLAWLNRNHGYSDFLTTVERLSVHDQLHIGVHLILGIPGESEADMVDSLRSVCDLPIHALKLHHLQVIRDTPLHRLYQQGQVEVLGLEEYLELLLRLLPWIPTSITLHRLWATSHPGLLIAPKWQMVTAELSKRLQQLMAARNIVQGQALTDQRGLTEEGA